MSLVDTALALERCSRLFSRVGCFASFQTQAMTTDLPINFVCACGKEARSACKDEPFFKEHEGKRYCVLHYPDKDKVEPFRAVLEKKLEAKDFNFKGVWFPERIHFESFKFSTDAEFTGAKFTSSAYFSNALFGADAIFRDAYFSNDAIFDYVTFTANVIFNFAEIRGSAVFRDAIFSADAKFDFIQLAIGGSFNRAIFKSYASFIGLTNAKTIYPFSHLGKNRNLGTAQLISFQFARFEKPERVTFHTLDLRPHWFINIDSRRFDFTDVEFKYDLKKELESFELANPIHVQSNPHRVLAIAFRQLADNAEANHRYHEASRLRYSAFEVRRIEKFLGFVPWRLDWWYWLASGYGESVGRAFVVFVLLIGLFALGYKTAEFEPLSKPAIARPEITATSQPPDSSETKPRRLGWREAALYSFNVSILQKPEPRPRGLWGGLLVSLETVLGPAQAALLALAVRRRFMR